MNSRCSHKHRSVSRARFLTGIGIVQILQGVLWFDFAGIEPAKLRVFGWFDNFPLITPQVIGSALIAAGVLSLVAGVRRRVDRLESVAFMAGLFMYAEIALLSTFAVLFGAPASGLVQAVTYGAFAFTVWHSATTAEPVKLSTTGETEIGGGRT